MARRGAAALAAALLVGGLLAPVPVLAGDGNIPVCTGDSISTNEDTSKSGTLDCSDVDPLTFAIGTAPDHGSVTIDNASTGAFTYDPALNYFGSDAFTFTASDADDGTADPATMSITINPVDDPPSFTPGSDQTDLEDAGAQTVTNWASGIDSGPPNESGQTVTFIVTGNTDSSLFAVDPAVNSGGDLTYTLANDANGSSDITLHAHDSGGANSPPATLTITVTPVNDAPSFDPGPDETVSENAGQQTVNGWAANISEGPSNESGQTVSFPITGNTNIALFSAGPAVSPDGTLTYTPAASKSGSATITLHIHDSGGTTNGGQPNGPDETFTINVSGVNDPPSFTKGANDSALEDAGPQTVDPWATAISPGPPDESGQTVTFVIDSVTNSSLFSSQPTVDSDGVLRYTPAANANGSSTVTLHAHDDGGGSTDDSPTQSFTITITAVNDAPGFTKGSNQTVAENAAAQTVTTWATNISEGPSNESSQTVTFSVTNDNNSLFSSQPAISPAGTLTYTPAASENGSATVSVQLHDNGGTANGGHDTSPTQTFTITVTGVNDPPSFTKGASQTDLEDAGPQIVNPWATAISPGPPDESSQNVSFVIDSNSNPALFSNGPTVDSDGVLRYSSAANANGSASIVLHAHDDGGGTTDDSLTQSFTIGVTAVNDAPSFTKGGNQTVLANAGAQTVTSWATNILEGPPNESGQTVVFSVTSDNTSLFSSQPGISPTGTLTYTPVPSESGSATVSVELQDNGGTANGGIDTSSTQTFTITLMGVNDPPSFAKGANQTFLEDSGAHSISGWATAISPGPPDESGQSVSFVVDSNIPDLFSSGPAVSPSGTLTFTPALNANGTSTVTVHAVDSGGTANGGDDTSLPQTFTITLTPVNDPPSFTKGPNQTAVEDSGLHTVTVWATNILEGPPDESTQVVDFVIDSDSNPTIFTVAPAVSPTGVLTYTLAPDATGVATIGLHAHDNGGVLNSGDDTSAIQTFTITVTGTNDAPICTTANNATFVNASLNATIGSCADIDADSLSYALVAQSAHGTTVVNPDGTYTYTPNANFLGNDSFTFKANDGTVDSNVAAMTLQVQADPIARNDVAPTDFPAIMQGSGPTAIPVLANDVDKQGGPLLVQSVTQGAKGTVTITGGGTGVSYDPTGLASGNDSFHYTIVDNQNRTNSAIVVVVITPDTIDPVVIAPMATIVSPSTLGLTSGKVRISWGASDAETGLKSIQLQEKLGTGAYKTVTLTSLKAKSSLRTLTFGKVYRYRVRATDVVGNVSPWMTSPPFVISRNQESSAAIVYGGPWGLAASTSYSAGKARWATAASASATMSFTGESIAWVSSRSTTRGSAEVYIDGLLVKTVSLKKTTTTHRQVVFGMSWPTPGPHTIQIVVLGTAGHPRVDLDALVVGH